MTLYRSGVLVLTKLPKLAFLKLALLEASKCVSKILYVDLLSSRTSEETASLSRSLLDEQQHSHHKHLQRIHYDFMHNVYSNSAYLCNGIDVRVLLPPQGQAGIRRVATTIPFDLCIANTTSIANVREFELLTNARYGFLNDRYHVRYIHAFDEFESMHDSNEQAQIKDDLPVPCSGVVIGGTFDRIHEGHKLLMGVAALLAMTKVTIGVSDVDLLKGKVLRELLQPTQERIEHVITFMKDIKPGLELKVVPLNDVAGPSGIDTDLQLLVLTQETINGSEYVNNIRKENGLYPLDTHVLNLLDDPADDMAKEIRQEVKISSTMKRIRLLGELIRPPRKTHSGRSPYIIGLTGGIASGKTAVAKRLQALGASVINCDLLGHEAYSPGRKAHTGIVEMFGTSVLKEDGTVDRKKLGAIVFADKAQLLALNQIVWPEIATMVSQRIDQLHKDGSSVVVVEAAVLLEAKWEDLVNEVWVTIIPEDEAVKRIINRDNIDKDQATIRVASQYSNSERVEHANVVLSTSWEPEFTQRQVEKAWELLRCRMEPMPLPHL